MYNQTYAIDPKVLRAYDIRGLYPSEINEELFFVIGQCFALEVQRLGKSKVCVGYDGRLSSPTLEQSLVEGLMSQGIQVERVGCGPSPLVYYANKKLGAGGALMVTGSHNPLPYNGLKMILNHMPFSGQRLQEFGLNLKMHHKTPTHPLPKIDPQGVCLQYVQELLQELQGHGQNLHSIKVAWDPGHGATSEILKQLIAQLPGQHFVINDTIDGLFPAHHPDPTLPENLVQLQSLVIQEKCDVGIAFDGDGDRIGVVDNRGKILRSDQLLCLFAADVLAHTPGAQILVDVKASQGLLHRIKDLGGMPVMTATGHSNIKLKMIDTKAMMAGEASGHIFFADRYHGFDDALYAAMRLIRILSLKPIVEQCWHQDLSQVFSMAELKIDVDFDQKKVMIEALKAQLAQENIVYSDIDGVRIDCAEGWWLVRASNTQDYISASVESSTTAGLQNLKAQMIAMLQTIGLAV